MTEADVIEQMVEYQNILLMGVSVFFTVISAYVVAIWAFLRKAGFWLRLFSFFFLSFVLAFLARIAYGSALIHNGFIDTLEDINRSAGLSPTGLATLENAASGLDAVIQHSLFFGVGIVYVALFFLTFFARATLRDA